MCWTRSISQSRLDENVGATYLVLYQLIGVILGHVAARGNGLVVRSLVSVGGDGGPVEFFGMGRICTMSVYHCPSGAWHGEEKALTWFLTLPLPLDAVALLKKATSRLLGLLRFAGVSGRRRRGDRAWYEVEDGAQPIEDVVLAGELAGVL